MRKKIYLLGILALFIACVDNPEVLYDKSKPIMDNSWQVKDQKLYWLEVQNPQLAYRIYINLRITNDYKYSNLFINLKTHGPNKEFITKRLEFKLADSEGDWLGNGSGNIFTYRIPITDTYKFAKKGAYKVEIEQDMRDNPLIGVVDIGLRIEERH